MSDAIELNPSDLALVQGAVAALPFAVGARIASVARLPQHASSRAYFRVTLDRAEASLVVMKMGADPLRSDEVTDGERPTRPPFVEVAQFLLAAGVPVVRILADLSAERLLLLEDLGDCTLFERLQQSERATWAAWYRRALDVLVGLHAAGHGAPSAACIALRRRFGYPLLRWELQHFREYALEARGVIPNAEQAAFLERAFDALATALGALPLGLAHRDYQSRNLMATAEGLRVIDFQDALLAPLPYDVVALLRDSYVALDPATVEGLVLHYLALRRRAGLPTPDDETYLAAFHLQSVQRKLKDAGRFVFIDRVKGNAAFLQNIPQSIRYVRGSVEWLASHGAYRQVTAWPAFAELLSQLVPEWAAA